jgi:S-formylglutathione hydrolase FrmB
LQNTGIDQELNKGIAEGKLPAMIVIMPDGGNSFYINSYDGQNNYESLFFERFLPTIEKKYRIKDLSRYRAIAGLSMGGFGALVYTIKHPDIFASCAALSAAVWTSSALEHMDDSLYQSLLAPVFGRGLSGYSRLTNQWRCNDPLTLISKKPEADLRETAFWIDCGDDDFLSEGNCYLHLYMTEKKIAHEFRVRDGSHEWSYWNSGIADVLTFFAGRFQDR